MTNHAYNPTTHRLAGVTTLVALLPIVVGALVTTMHAGMAFLDWPTSDGHNMLLYDWLRDLRAGRLDKFVEHGHRLAGMVIGILGIALVLVAWRTRNRPAVRWLATAALGGIIVQGLLGGARVIQNERLLALLHGQFAAVVFSLLAVTWLVTGRTWSREAPRSTTGSGFHADPRSRCRASTLALALVTPVVLILQYVLGGLLRHLGTAMFEHIGLAIVAFGLVVASAVTALLSGSAWLRRSGWALLLLVHAQVALGVLAFLAKYGFAPTGYVAVRGSAMQLLTASAHTVVGMVLVATSVVYAAKVLRLRATEPTEPAPQSMPVVANGVAVNGGVG